MRSRLGPFRPARRGKFMILTALLLPVLLGGAAVSVDLGVMWSVQARLTNIADAAALAGAGRLLQGQSTESASSAASAIAALSAYSAYGQTSTVTVNIPPVAPSAFAGQSDCVQAVVQFNQPALFRRNLGQSILAGDRPRRGPSGFVTLLERRHSLTSTFGHRDDALGLVAGSRGWRRDHG